MVTLKTVRHVVAVLTAFVVAAHQRLRRLWPAGRGITVQIQIPVLCFFYNDRSPPERKEAGTSEKKSRLLRILHCLFHCGALFLFLLRQKYSDLHLHAAELLFFRIRESRVVFQRKGASVPEHGKLLV